MHTATTAVRRNNRFIIIVLIAVAIAAAVYSFFSLRPALNPDLLRVSGNIEGTLCE